MMRLNAKIVCAAAMVLAACAGTLPEVSPAAVQRASALWPGIGDERLSAGRTLFIAKCSGCHSLPQPSLYSGDDWKVKLDEMAARAKLSREETEQIYQYLFSTAKQTSAARQ